MRLLIIFMGFVLFESCWANPGQIIGMRFWEQTFPNTRLIFDLSTPVIHNIFTLKSPNRLVIDFRNTQLATKLEPLPHHTLVENIRSATRNQNDLRIVLDLKLPVRIKSFLLEPKNTTGHRLVIDLNVTSKNNAVYSSKTPVQSFVSSETSLLQKRAVSSPKVTFHSSHHSNSKRDIIIAIDAGHGGIDPGAVGQGGTREKEVALAIAKKLAEMINKERGLSAILIRKADYFIRLRQRIELARKYHADLFVSIHADAYQDNENVQGSSVYMLSRSGASSEAARWLANKENSADLIDGISLSDKDDLLASVLLDLSQAGSLKASAHVGQKVLKALSQVSRNHFTTVQSAGFIVLRSPDIPSILVETGFLSNPKEEQKLNDPKYRFHLAKQIFEGLQDYFADYAPPDTLLAHR